MIKFFRTLRHGLLNQNKFSKYLLYAIGEIFLVVIGILIALQINAWNEGRKEKIQERKVLIELKKSLENNSKEMVEDSLRREHWNRSSDVIIFTLQQKNKYNDTLNIHFHNARLPGTNLSLSTAGYEGLKNAGFNIISSDVLRNRIVELFEISQKNLLEEMEYFESFQPDRQIQVDRLFSYEEEKFDQTKPFSVPITPHNYPELLDNLVYQAMIKSVKVQRNIIGVILNKNLQESQRVLQLINEELDKIIV